MLEVLHNSKKKRYKIIIKKNNVKFILSYVITTKVSKDL